MSSTSKPVLRIDWATHEAAKFACLNWHYSKSVPAGKTTKIGVWEDGKFIGVIIYARGSNKHIGAPFNLDQTQVIELVRVALTSHKSQVSKIIAISIRFIKEFSSGIRLVVSFADSGQGHHGGIYQAGNWIYSGNGTTDQRSQPYKRNGVIAHWRTVASELTKKRISATIIGAKKIGWEPQGKNIKYRYLMPLDDDMRKQIAPLAKPYPKRVKKQDSEHPSELGGAVPTDTLQSLNK